MSPMAASLSNSTIPVTTMEVSGGPDNSSGLAVCAACSTPNGYKVHFFVVYVDEAHVASTPPVEVFDLGTTEVCIKKSWVASSR